MKTLTTLLIALAIPSIFAAESSALVETSAVLSINDDSFSTPRVTAKAGQRATIETGTLEHNKVGYKFKVDTETTKNDDGILYSLAFSISPPKSEAIEFSSRGVTPSSKPLEYSISKDGIKYVITVTLLAK